MKAKKLLSMLLSATMLAGTTAAVNAEDYKWNDTTAVVEGVEVLKEGVNFWQARYQHGSGNIYLTRESYEGNGAMLIVTGDGGSDAANIGLSKHSADRDNKDNMIEGDTYKIEFYQKLIRGGLCLGNRYYSQYNGITFTAYDPDTGAVVTAPETGKWYRVATEFVADGAHVAQGDGVGLALISGGAYIVDSVKMWHSVDGEWHEMAEATGLRNGGFEEGVSEYKEPVYPDTTTFIDGVEVIEEGVPHWLERYQVGSGTKLYKTHDSYAGNGAMLIAGNDTDVTNYQLNKNWESYGDDQKLVAGETYKVECYQKAITGNLKINFRFYNSYDVIQNATVYDAETGEVVTGTPEKNKWYKIEKEFNLPVGADSQWTGYSFYGGVGTTIVDELKMYRKLNGEFVLMNPASACAVRNGDFEEGVNAVKGVNPTGVSAVAGIDSVTISWTNPQEQETRIYNGDKLVATAVAGATSATVTGLESATYTFTVKGVLSGIESSGVEVSVSLVEAEYPDTIGLIAGVEFFAEEGNNYDIPAWQKSYLQPGQTNLGLYLTHDAYKGSSAMVVKADSAAGADSANTGISKKGMVSGDTYKLVMYQKPLTKDASGKYILNTLYRYYDNYDVHNFSVYDIETNQLADTNNLESKWYRLEREFVANGEVYGTNAAFAIWTEGNSNTFIVDEVTMYHKVNDEWVALGNGDALNNGSFETGVESIFGVDPENVKVENKTESVIISWTEPTNQKVKVYNGDTVVATAEVGATTVVVENLTGDKEYTFVVKGVGSYSESDGVEVSAFPFGKLADTTAIVNGVEVFAEGAAHWLSQYQENPANIYLTHEAYEGNAGLLIIPATDGSTSVTNYQVDKGPVVEGDPHKLVFYMKPIGGQLFTSHRYFNDYTVLGFTAYDAETGELAGSTVDPEKWYRLEHEFIASAGHASDWCAFAVRVTSPVIIDSLQLYNKVDGEWNLMPDMHGVRNGGLEQGVTGDDTAPYEVENVKATAGDSSATLTWDAVEVTDLAGYAIYNGDVLVADIARNVTEYTVTGLTNDVEVTLTVKAYDRVGNTSEGTSVSVIPTIPEYVTTDYVAGDKVVAGANAVSVSITNNKNADGMTAQLIVGLYDKDTGALIKASASEIATVAKGASADLSSSVTVDNLDSANYEIKAYLWKSLSSVSPLKGVLVIAE